MWIRALYYTKTALDTVRVDTAERTAFQQERFQQIHDACLDLPFYKEHWSDVPAGDVASPTQLPLLREDALPRITSFTQRQQEEPLSRSTSGTTGTPTQIIFTEQAHDWLSAIYARTLYLQGYRPTQQILQSWQEMKEQRTWIGKKLIPKQYVDPNTAVTRQLRQMKTVQPDVLQYFPQTLLAICKQLQARNQTFNPQTVLTYGELLTPAMRQYIEDTLNAPVRDQYATAEFGVVGWECPDGGYHLVEDAVHAEICDAAGQPHTAPATTGQLVLTGLVNTATPLVRYAIGDVVETAEQSCSCNTQFKRMKRVRGREDQVFLNAAGEPVFPDEVVDIVAPTEAILFYQLQAADASYTLRYVQNDKASPDGLEPAADRLRTELTLEPLTLEHVDSIPQSNAGKIKIIENNQSHPSDKLF